MGRSSKSLPPNITHKESHFAERRRGEIASELYIAREKLAVSPQDAVNISRNKSSTIQTWSTYCKEIGSTKRRLGEMIDEQKRTVGLNQGMLLRGTSEEPRDTRPTLAEVGIDKKLSSRAQKLLDIHR